MHYKQAPFVPKRRAWVLISGGIALAAAGATFLLLSYIPPGYAPSYVAITPQETPPAAATVSLPVRLSIASIGVDTIIQPTGLTNDGDMAISDNAVEVAWYRLGPKPGEAGSAVIAGHYGWKDGVGSVFNELHTLRPGSTVTVYGDGGEAKSFTVLRIRTYNPDDDASEVFKSHDGKAYLNLITCSGEWNDSLKTYSERIVVFTEYQPLSS